MMALESAARDGQPPGAPRPPSVLFVCTANICRSPMAMALFRALLQNERADWARWRIESAGTWAPDGAAVSRRSAQVIAQRGMDIRAHRARTVSLELLEGFDLILTMEPGHKEAISIEFPSVAGRVFMLSEMVGLNAAVEDPYGSPVEKYQEAAETIEHYLSTGMPRILELVERRRSQEGA